MNTIPMNQFTRFKHSLRKMLDKYRHDIEKTRKDGKITADYSLGFINALIFCDHQANGRGGNPQYYNRTTSVGQLPKPIALNSGNRTKDTSTYQILMDVVLMNARQLFALGNTGAGQHAVGEAMGKLEGSIKELDKFVGGEKAAAEMTPEEIQEAKAELKQMEEENVGHTVRNESGPDAQPQPS